MNTLPNNLKQISLFLERLPGIGEKTANRLAFYLLRLPERDLKEFADTSRDHEIITVVEEVLDLLSFETGNIYKGVYYVLHGKIDPLNHIGPEDIYIQQLLDRVSELTSSRVNGLKKNRIKEIILAMNPDMEGEATAMYIRDRLKEVKKHNGVYFKITRL